MHLNPTRRQFLKTSAAFCALAPWPAAAAPLSASGPNPDVELLLTEARHYEKLPHKKIRCQLCPRACVIDDLERGYCGVRENRNGVYYTLVHSRPCSVHIDPIEKKPLFHFLPGTSAFSIATVGCNVECVFCQNWEISQMRPEQAQNYDLPPQAVADLAAQKQCASIAYTYTEPVVFEEYMFDCATAGRNRNVRSVMISNGYIQEKPMIELCSVLSAVKIDLKAFTQKFYSDLVSGELQPVLDTLKLLAKQKIWLEIVYLVIPTKNDDQGELREMCQWIARDLNTDVPLHFTRFYPQYRLKNLSPTPAVTLRSAREIALKEGLHYVYTGNMPGDEGENTYCPKCREAIIRRVGYQILKNDLVDGKCNKCGQRIAGVWK